MVACFVEGAVKAEAAAAARIAAGGSDGETPSCSLTPTLLPGSPCVGTQQESATGELTSKSTGASGQRQRAEQRRGGEKD